MEVFTTQGWPTETLRRAFSLTLPARTNGHLFCNQMWWTADGQLSNIWFKGEFVHQVGSLKQIRDRIFQVCFIFLQNLAFWIISVCYWGSVSPLSIFVHCTILAMPQVQYIMDLSYCPGPTHRQKTPYGSHN